MARTAALPTLTAEPGFTHYLEEIRRFPMLERQEEYMLAKRWREHGDRERGAQARHQPSAARGQDRQGLSRLRPADLRGDLGGQCRPDAGGRALRAGKGLPPRHLRHVVDQGGDPGIHPALVVAGEDGHHGQPEEAVLQPAQGQEQDFRPRRGRYAAGPGEDHRPAARRHRNGRDLHEPAARRRRLAQRPDPRGRRFRRVAGLAGGRIPGPGDDARRERGVR